MDDPRWCAAPTPPTDVERVALRVEAMADWLRTQPNDADLADIWADVAAFIRTPEENDHA